MNPNMNGHHGSSFWTSFERCSSRMPLLPLRALYKRSKLVQAQSGAGAPRPATGTTVPSSVGLPGIADAHIGNRAGARRSRPPVPSHISKTQSQGTWGCMAAMLSFRLGFPVVDTQRRIPILRFLPHFLSLGGASKGQIFFNNSFQRFQASS